MRPHSLWVLCFVSATLAVSPQGQGPRPTSAALAGIMPAGALLYLESPDFATLVRDWNGSSEKKAWLESDDFKVFSRSRLFLRLKEAQQEFASAAGIPPDMSLVESVAGGEAALALYDIGNLKFLYIARMPSSRALDNALWRAREKFEPRKAADIAYYLRSEPTKNRVVAFATTEDYLLLATGEDLMAGALAAIAGKTISTVKGEKWFADATAAAGERGDLRMVMNIGALVKSPHFRSYWVQRNVSELRQYTAEVVDVHRSSGEIREDRVLLRSAPGGGNVEKPKKDESVLADLLRLVPGQVGLYRAWSGPSVDDILGLLERKVLSPHLGPGAPAAQAPVVVLTGGQVGSESELETRIDVPPLASAGGNFGPAVLKDLLEAGKPRGALQLASTRPVPGSVFVGTESAIVLEAAGDWNGEEVRTALLSEVEGLWTTSRLGVHWVENKSGDATYYQLDGLARLAMAARGHTLIIANAGELVVEVLKRVSNPPVKSAGVYAAGFRHNPERENLLSMVRLIEVPLAQQFGAGRGPQGHEPLFFSENLASLSESLARVQEESILVRDLGPSVSQTVIYRLNQ
jgi:hypothetical protein